MKQELETLAQSPALQFLAICEAFPHLSTSLGLTTPVS